MQGLLYARQVLIGYLAQQVLNFSEFIFSSKTSGHRAPPKNQISLRIRTPFHSAWHKVGRPMHGCCQSESFYY